MSAPTAGADLRRVMSRWATGVSVVTGRGPEGDVGLTVNALLSVSLEPPRLLVSLSTSADSTPVIEASRRFAVSFLAADQRRWSERFAQTLPVHQKFEGVPIHRGATGAPLLDDALGWVECRVESAVGVADHRLLIGEVVATAVGRDAPPLLFLRRGYAEAGPDGRITLPTPRD